MGKSELRFVAFVYSLSPMNMLRVHMNIHFSEWQFASEESKKTSAENLSHQQRSFHIASHGSGFFRNSRGIRFHSQASWLHFSSRFSIIDFDKFA